MSRGGLFGLRLDIGSGKSMLVVTLAQAIANNCELASSFTFTAISNQFEAISLVDAE